MGPASGVTSFQSASEKRAMASASFDRIAVPQAFKYSSNSSRKLSVIVPLTCFHIGLEAQQLGRPHLLRARQPILQLRDGCRIEAIDAHAGIELRVLLGDDARVP